MCLLLNGQSVKFTQMRARSAACPESLEFSFIGDLSNTYKMCDVRKDIYSLRLDSCKYMNLFKAVRRHARRLFRTFCLVLTKKKITHRSRTNFGVTFPLVFSSFIFL